MKIKELRIYTSKFSEQVEFYSQKMGIKLLQRSDAEAQFKIGNSILVLIRSDKFQPYHFAINIPSNQEEEALQWLKSRVSILKDDDNEIQRFDNWNAKSVYFYDADKNIVEFIARKELATESMDVFSSESLLEVSEIGVPVRNILDTYEVIKATVNLPVYDGGPERFCAIGDETGLFICINKGEKNYWFPTSDKAYSSDFEIIFEEKGIKYKLQFEEESIKVATV